MRKITIFIITLILLTGFMLFPEAIIKAESNIQSVNADSNKKIAYISTLGELLSYTFDFYTESHKYNEKAFNDYILILTKDMDVNTDTSWQEYVHDWNTYGWYARSTFASIEGGGHTISNLWAVPDFESNGGRRKVSLLDSMADNFVRNLNITYDNSKMIKKPDIIPDDRFSYWGDYGGLVNECDNSLISNVHVKGNFYLAGNAGGIANWPVHSVIENSSFEGELMGSNVGGIGAYSYNISIKNCLFKGSIIAVGGGGLFDRPRSGGMAVEFSNNIALITDIQEIDFGFYSSFYQPRGTFFGNCIEKDIQNFTFKDNYVLNVKDYTHASMTPGIMEHIGGETKGLDFLPEEVKGFNEISDFADINNFPGLDFKNYWYMDNVVGHPKLKRNFVSIINLSDKKFNDNFIIRTENRLYSSNEQAKVESTIRDKKLCQLTYFTLDGVDVLKSLTPNSLPLFMTSNHILVVKAEQLGLINFNNLDNIISLTLNGNIIDINNSKSSYNYRIGEVIKFSFQLAENYEVKNVIVNNGYVITESENEYTFTISKKSILDSPDRKSVV